MRVGGGGGRRATLIFFSSLAAAAFHAAAFTGIADAKSAVQLRPAAPRVVSGSQYTTVQQLSNETTYTTIGTANWTAAIRSQPSSSAPVISHLRYFTQDDEALQTYLELEVEVFKGTQSWTEIRVPGRPNGRVGWVPTVALQFSALTHTQVVVNREAEKLQIYVKGVLKLTVPVGVGHWHNPTWPTPAGHFWITESFPSSDSFYGPWVYGTSDYAADTDFPDGSIVGIHGTSEPWLVPGDPSHGCVRMRNSSLQQVRRYVSIGDALLIK